MGQTIRVEDLTERGANASGSVYRGSVLPTMYKKLLENSLEVLYDKLQASGDKQLVTGISRYLQLAVYKMFRHLYRADGNNNEDFFAVPARNFVSGLANADMSVSEVRYVDALAAQVKESGSLPPINHDALTQSYPGAYQSLLQIIHNTGERVGRRLEEK